MVRVKEHFMGLQKISTNHESAPKTEFCMRYLQFRIQARNHNIIFTPVELKSFAR
jgi:hypothetical protein